MSDWDAALYKRFERERTLPAINLADAIVRESCEKIIDIGCGTGNSTAVLMKKFTQAEVTGIDNSENMLCEARKSCTGAKFLRLDVNEELETLTERFDVVFSNACIQWLPNHRRLLVRFMNLLTDGGVLAVQTPLQAKHPMHKIITAVANGTKWRHYLSNIRVFYNLTAEEYYDVLGEISSDFSIWETVYMHRMPSHESIIEWYRGTGLRPYLNALDEEMYAEFERDVFRETVSYYTVRKNGEILFEFPRLFFTAVK